MGPICHKCGKLVETGDVLCSDHEQEVLQALVAKARLEEAQWWADHDIEDYDTQSQWDEIASERIAELEKSIVTN